MIIRSITLNNYGLFRGQHTIDLTPKQGKPIVLVGGKNGAGKTTLLEALQLCMYGPAALGERLSRDSYNALLAQKIHSSPTLLIQPTFASVSLEFDYADLGRLERYEVARSWEKSASGRITEDLRVKRNGLEEGDLTAEQWGDFVRELIPPGVSRLFFFDGEKIQQLAEDSSDQRELGLSLKALLGTDLIERLQADLSIYRSRIGKADRSTSETAAFEHAARVVEESEHRSKQLEVDCRLCDAQLNDIRGRIGACERRLAAEGGAFARSRDAIISQREEARLRVATLEQSIRHLAQGPLPFNFCADLCSQLRAEISREVDLQRETSGRELLERARATLLRELKALSWLPTEAEISPKSAKMISTRIRQLIEKTYSIVAPHSGIKDSTVGPIHQMSVNEHTLALQWMDQAEHETAPRLSELGRELESAYRTFQKAEEALKRIPADDALAPLIAELQTLNRAYGEQSARTMAKAEALRQEQNGLSDARRRLSEEAEKLNQGATDATKLRMISRTQAALDEFRESILDRKVRDLEEAVTRCFNLLSRKKDAVKRVSINPRTFSVVLFGRDGAQIPKDRLSAGEKQIYAIAMLWALARTSGRPLPVMIDTPLGRLDSDHRRLLVERYFPSASHQVIVLSTDTEINTTYFDSLRPFISSCYKLEYDMVQRSTAVTPGYFFDSEHEANKTSTN